MRFDLVYFRFGLVWCDKLIWLYIVFYKVVLAVVFIWLFMVLFSLLAMV